jgi:hypothetical protein
MANIAYLYNNDTYSTQIKTLLDSKNIAYTTKTVKNWNHDPADDGQISSDDFAKLFPGNNKPVVDMDGEIIKGLAALRTKLG